MAKKYNYPKDGGLRINLNQKTHKKLFDLARDDGRELKVFIERICEKCNK